MMMVAAASQGALQQGGQPGMVPPMPGQAYMNPASQYSASLAQYVTSTSQYVTAPAPPHYVTSSHHHPVIFFMLVIQIPLYPTFLTKGSMALLFEGHIF